MVQIAQRSHAAEIVALGDPRLLESRANALGLPLAWRRWTPGQNRREPSEPGSLLVAPIPLNAPVTCGRPDPRNARYVLDQLDHAAAKCLTGGYDAMVTGPAHKGVINDAGIPFTGHTEYLAAATGGATPVMMLCSQDLRVALITTHLPLAEVPGQISEKRIKTIIAIVERGLKQHFGIARPRIAVCGLNPHAGEGGYLGHEEIDAIIPALTQLRRAGIPVVGPLPADTAFTPEHLRRYDVIVTMYHDQGLPVLKSHGFGNAVNVTLGLPIIRTSVDHGTALELAGTGRADPGSLNSAIAVAIAMVRHATE